MVTYSRRPLFRRGASGGSSSYWQGEILDPNSVPVTAILTEDGLPILTEDGQFLLTES